MGFFSPSMLRSSLFVIQAVAVAFRRRISNDLDNSLAGGIALNLS